MGGAENAQASMWIGPVVIATLISSFVTVIGWYVTRQRDRQIEIERREEKIRDIQTALLAEINSNINRYSRVNLRDAADAARETILNEQGYTPFVPKDASTTIFETILKEIHVLPSGTIESIVSYYRQGFVLSYFVEDLKSEAYSKLSQPRKAEMYVEYLGMMASALDRAKDAQSVLHQSLGSKPILSGQASDRQPASSAEPNLNSQASDRQSASSAQPGA